MLCTIAEIPPPIRDYQRNVILFALHHSPIGPTAEILLGSIVKTIKRLQTSGLIINLRKRDKYNLFLKRTSPDSDKKFLTVLI